jgi:hypothetical protein
MPGVLLSPFHQPERSPLSRRVAHFSFLELEALLPHSALIVHHGFAEVSAATSSPGAERLDVLLPLLVDTFVGVRASDCLETPNVEGAARAAVDGAGLGLRVVEMVGFVSQKALADEPAPESVVHALADVVELP